MFHFAYVFLFEDSKCGRANFRMVNQTLFTILSKFNWLSIKRIIGPGGL